jgi:hypothetical protein
VSLPGPSPACSRRPLDCRPLAGGLRRSRGCGCCSPLLVCRQPAADRQCAKRGDRRRDVDMIAPLPEHSPGQRLTTCRSGSGGHPVSPSVISPPPLLWGSRLIRSVTCRRRGDSSPGSGDRGTASTPGERSGVDRLRGEHQVSIRPANRRAVGGHPDGEIRPTPRARVPGLVPPRRAAATVSSGLLLAVVASASPRQPPYATTWYLIHRTFSLY